VDNHRALIVGAGALGSPLAWLLARSGVRAVGLADPDVVELSNLNRQILFRSSHLGRRKVDVVAEYLKEHFPQIEVEPLALRVDAANALALFRNFDFIADATDGVTSKYVCNDASILAGKPLSHAGIVGLRGQTMTILPGRSACLRCVFPEPPAETDIPSCHQAGIIGPVAGAIASLQAGEVLCHRQGEPVRFSDRLLTWDAARWRWHGVRVKRVELCPVCGPRPSISASNLGAGVPAEHAGLPRL